MIVIMKESATSEDTSKVIDVLYAKGMQVQINNGSSCSVLGVLGDTYTIDKEKIGLMEGVERVVAVQEPYKKANRKFHPKDTVITVGDVSIGGGDLCIMAGPCSIESEEQLTQIASSIKKTGANVLRGGAFKPRSSPYAFQGLGANGLDILSSVKAKENMPAVTELMSAKYIELFAGKVDIIQIGARNMQNFDLLKEVAKINKPVLLKRGLSNTVEEWLMSAEYIMSGGNPNVILCERGIRTFESYTRNTLDLSAIPIVKKLSHLPVLVDPSHATGHSYLVESMSLAAIAAGADGLMIEVHNNPTEAMCDGPQSVTPQKFAQIMEKVKILKGVIN